MTRAYVLDASALLTLIPRRRPGGRGKMIERGAERVAEILERTPVAMSAANWAEVLSKLADHGAPAERVLRVLERGAGVSIGRDIVLFDLDRNQAEEIAALRRRTRGFGLSLGDRSCLALARTLGATALTTDEDWLEVGRRHPQLGLEVENVRPRR